MKMSIIKSEIMTWATDSKVQTVAGTHTSESSTSTNARHTHAQNQSSKNQTISARAYA